MRFKKVMKPIIVALAAVMLVSAIAPTAVNFNEVVEAKKDKKKSKSIKSSKLYKELSSAKKKQFKKIKKWTTGKKITKKQQMKLLKKRHKQENLISPRIRTALIKNAVRFGAECLGIFVKKKGIVAIVNFVTDFEGKWQTAFEKAFIKYLGVNKTAAYWAAKFIIFVFF